MNRSEVPGAEMLDAAMLSVAGFLCIVPGFISGTIGLLLLIGPLRRPVGRRLVRRWTRIGSVAGSARRRSTVEVQWIGDVTTTTAPTTAPTEIGPVRD
jgi:UPF0716 family protein affecting phage T7 exclusion